MTGLAIAVSAAAFLLSFYVTGRLREYALRSAMVDMPNERSSHTSPTPRGGGLAIVLACLGAVGVLCAGGVVELRVAIALFGGAAVAAVGFADDRIPVPALLRLIVHVGSAVWALAWLGGVPPIQLGAHEYSAGWAGQIVGLVAIVWVLNLFNFMDGIDGLAASEAAFIAGAGALLGTTIGQTPAVAAISLALMAASVGFLLWNWPPARIFLGDVGSGFLGYTIAVLALVAARENAVGGLAWLILGSVFFADATITLLRRVGGGALPHEPHRTHAYQRLARRWSGHRPVTLAFITINLVWAMPLAAAALARPGQAAALVVLAIVPLAIAAAAIGAGRSEHGD